MTVLAIDPGNIQSAFVLWDGEHILDKGDLPNEEIRLIIKRSGNLICPPVLAIEQIKSYGMSVGESIFETCVWTGRFMQTWIDAGENDLVRIPRLEVKVHLCKSARANDGNVRQALIDRIGEPGRKKAPGPTYGCSGDIWAALAVGVTVHDRITVGVV